MLDLWCGLCGKTKTHFAVLERCTDAETCYKCPSCLHLIFTKRKRVKRGDGATK